MSTTKTNSASKLPAVSRLTELPIWQVLLSALLLLGLVSYLRLEVAVVGRYKLLLIALIIYALYALWRRPEDALTPLVMTHYVVGFWLWNLWLGQNLPFWLMLLGQLGLAVGAGWLFFRLTHTDYPAQFWLRVSLLAVGLAEVVFWLAFWQTHPSDRAITVTIAIGLSLLVLFPEAEPNNLPGVVLAGLGIASLLVILGTAHWGLLG